MKRFFGIMISLIALFAVAKADEVLIEVRAIGINRADLLQRKGTFKDGRGQRRH